MRKKTIPVRIGTSLRDAEKLIIEATLRHTDNNVSRSATILGIDRSTLYQKIKEYKLKGRDTPVVPEVNPWNETRS